MKLPCLFNILSFHFWTFKHQFNSWTSFMDKLLYPCECQNWSRNSIMFIDRHCLTELYVQLQFLRQTFFSRNLSTYASNTLNVFRGDAKCASECVALIIFLICILIAKVIFDHKKAFGHQFWFASLYHVLLLYFYARKNSLKILRTISYKKVGANKKPFILGRNVLLIMRWNISLQLNLRKKLT